MKAGKSGGTADAAEVARLPEFVRVRGAREHSLKNVDVDIPRDALVCVQGIGQVVARAGTLYAEAQRRYLQSAAPMREPGQRPGEGVKPRTVPPARRGLCEGDTKVRTPKDSAGVNPSPES